MPRMREQTFETDAFRSLLFIRGGPAQPAGVKGYGLLWIGPRSGSGLCRPGELLRPRALMGIPYSGVDGNQGLEKNVGGGYVWAL